MAVDDKKKILITVTTLLVLLVGGTFAFFVANISDGASQDATIISEKLDDLRFEVDKEIGLSITTDTLVEGGSSLVNTSTAKASLKANAETNTANYSYYVYFDIETNEFIYTKNEDSPEILLNVFDPNGNEITDINGLDYIDSLGAYDITTTTGIFTIEENRSITSNSSQVYTEQEWTFRVEFVNFDDHNQIENANKELKAYIILKKDPMNTLADHIKNLYTTQGENGLYHHDGTITAASVGLTGDTILDAEDGSYRYAGVDYVLTQKAIDEGYTIIRSNTNTTLIEYYCGNYKYSYSNSCYYNDYTVAFKLKYDNSEYGTFYEALTKAIEDGYVERKINNYVCFGYDGAYSGSCDYNNLYRIIGVFGNNIKLIKADYVNDTSLLGDDGDFYSLVSLTPYSSYFDADYVGGNTQFAKYYKNNVNSALTYNTTGVYNTFGLSAFFNVNLNTNFINNIDHGDEGSWSGKIKEMKWRNADSDFTNAKSCYNKEHGLSVYPYLDMAGKIGLIYPSEYVYAGVANSWNTDFSSYTGVSKGFEGNWMFLGYSEPTYAYLSNNTTDYTKSTSCCLNSSGTVSKGCGNGNTYVRPAFYLLASVEYDSGTGSFVDPFIVK